MKTAIRDSAFSIKKWFGFMAITALISGFLCVIVGIPIIEASIGFAAIALPVSIARIATFLGKPSHKSPNSENHVFLGAPNWRDRFHIASDDSKGNSLAVAEKECDKEPITQSIHKTYPIFSTKKNILGYYWRIEDICNTIQCGYIGQAEKNRAAHLKKLADNVVEHLQDLDDIGRLDECSVMIVDGEKQQCDYSHADKGEAKLKSIFNRLDNALIKQASKISNQIDGIKVDDCI